jgi:hypothetical protein
MTRALSVLLAVQLGCFAPQRAGAARVAYISMATTDAAFAGGIGGAIACGLATGGFSHGGGNEKATAICFGAGAIAGGAGALYGSLETEDEPDTAAWIVISLPAALFVLATIGGVVNRLKK